MGKPLLAGIEHGRDLAEATLLSAIVNSSDDAIVGKNPDGVITSWNPAAERIYGYLAAEIIGQPMAVLCPPDRVGEITEILDTIGRGEHVVHYETRRLRKDGTTIPVSVTVSPIRDESGRLIGASSIARDITEQLHATAELRRRADDLELANQNLEKFTHLVAHDLRAPLQAMSGFSGALLEEYGDVLDQVGRRYAERIQVNSEQMAALLDSLLQLFRLSRAAMNPGPVDLSAEVAAIAGELQAAEPDRRVRFTIQAGVRVSADRTLIRSVLRNLVENAWKFTSGRDDASIEFGSTPASDAPVCCYIRDNGVGFDPAYAIKLFQPFQRLHSDREYRGTGLGLASVKQIVEHHGGRVWAEGAVGEGATFYFTLDVKESE